MHTLQKLTLTHFRLFRHLEIDFHPNLTVLIAPNGEGKTAVLDAARIALWPYVSGFDLATIPGSTTAHAITADDIHSTLKEILKAPAITQMAPQLPCAITAHGDLGTTATWRRYRDSEQPHKRTKDDGNCRQLKKNALELQKKAKDLASAPETLPMLAYYGTGRVWSKKRLTATSTRNHLKREFAYVNCLDPASNFPHFANWFADADQKIREQKHHQEEHGTPSPIIPELRHPIEVVQKAVDRILAPTGWKNLRHSVSYGRTLILEHDIHGVTKVDTLGDGIRATLAIAADIAFRCFQLNPHLGEAAAQKTPGLVLIDEVDMHLHPQWQQTITASLTEAFPGLQFIVTTHSPQVLSTVKAESIRLLQTTLDPETGALTSQATQPSEQSQGVSSDLLMAKLQNTSPVPDIPQNAWLDRYHELIEYDQENTAEGIQLKKAIINHFGENHSLWRECERIINLRRLRARLPVQKTG